MTISLVSPAIPAVPETFWKDGRPAVAASYDTMWFEQRGEQWVLCYSDDSFYAEELEMVPANG